MHPISRPVPSAPRSPMSNRLRSGARSRPTIWGTWPPNASPPFGITHLAMGIRFAERMDRLGTEGAFEVLARARRLEATGRRIVHLEIGEPDFATPDNITEAAVSALHAGYTHYTPAGGLMEAREAVARFVSSRLGVAAEPT